MAHPLTWDEANEKLKKLFPESKERGRIRAKLLDLEESKRVAYFQDDDEAVKESLAYFAAPARIDSQLATSLEELREDFRDFISHLAPIAKIARAAFLNQFRPAESKASSTTKYRPKAVTAYRDTQRGGPKGYLRCMITGLWFPEKKIKAGHVYRQTWAPNVLEDANMTVHDPRNIILMLDQLEERFDKWHWTLLPIGDTVYQVYLLNPELREPGVSPRVKYLWSRGEEDEKKHNGSSGSGRGGKKGRPSEGLGCEQEQEMVEEGEADDDKKITSGSSADEVKEVSRAEEGGEEDGGRGSGLENGPQRPQGGRNGQEPVGTSGGGMRVDVANLDENGPTWASLHMKELRFEGSCQPAKRVCGFHAYMAIKDAETKGWILRGSVEVPDAAWGSPTFDKKLMDVYLHDSFEYASSVWSDSPHDAGSPENTPKGGELL